MSDLSLAALRAIDQLTADVRSLKRHQANSIRVAALGPNVSVFGDSVVIYPPTTPTVPGDPLDPLDPVLPPPVVVIGTDPTTGTHGVEVNGGPPPPAPSIPLVAQIPEGVTVTWGGQDATGSNAWTPHLSHVSVRASTVPGEPEDAIEVARLPAQKGNRYGGAATLAQPAGVTTYVHLVAVLTSGVTSDPSVEVEAVGGTTPGLADLEDELDANTAAVALLTGTTIPGLNTALDDLTADLATASGDITALEGRFPVTAPDIAANAVTTNKLDALAVTAAKIAANTITAAQIAANTITAAQILAGTITALELGALSVTTVKLAANAVTAAKIAAGTITTNELAADSVTAVQILAGTVTSAEIATGAITADKLDVNVLRSGFTITGSLQIGTDGSRWNPAEGLIIPGVVNLSTAAATITAAITATSLTVQKDLNLLGNTNQIKGTLTLANGIVAPVTKPSMYQSWSLVGAHSMPFGATDYGLSAHLSDGTKWLTTVAFFGGGIIAINKSDGQYSGSLATNNPAVAEYRAWCVDFNPVGGMTALGGSYYVLGFDSARSNAFYIYKLDATFNKVAELAIASSFSSGKPAIGNDGANILYSYPASGNKVNLRSVDPATFNAVTVIGDVTIASATGREVVYVGKGTFSNYFGVGVTRYVIGIAGLGNYVLDATLAVQATSYMPPAVGGTVRGLAFDGTRFISYNTDGSLYRHGVLADSRTLTGSYTWYDGDTSSGSVAHETQESPAETFAQAAGTYVTVQTSEAPDSGVTDAAQRDKANLVRVYVGIGAGGRKLQDGAGVNDSLGLDGSSRTIRELQIDTVATATASPPGANGFTGVSGAAGLIQTFGSSAIVGVSISGDGSGAIAGVTWDAAGNFTSTKPPMSTTGWLQPGSGGVAYGTGWGAWSDTTNELVAAMKVGTEVRIVGLCRRTSGTGLVALNVPAAMRPNRTIWRWLNANGSWGQCTISTGGDVAIFNPAPVTGQFYSFDISYHTNEP